MNTHQIFIFFLISIFTTLSICSAEDEKGTQLFSRILPYAILASAIYEDEYTFVATVKAQNLKLNEHENITGIEITYAHLSDLNNNKHIIVIRGTANLENAITDMTIRLVPDQRTGIKLHQGFLEAAQPIYQKLKNRFNKTDNIVITGHSLGGAVAVILGMQLTNEGFSVSEVVTFGQPKVTNIGGAKKFETLNIIRVVNVNDMVPIVPPMALLDLKKLDIYWHLGKEIILMKKKEYAELEGVKSMLRSIDFITSTPKQKNLESHKMINYVSIIKNNASPTKPGLTKVAFKNSFNPLSLFGD